MFNHERTYVEIWQKIPGEKPTEQAKKIFKKKIKDRMVKLGYYQSKPTERIIKNLVLSANDEIATMITTYITLVSTNKKKYCWSDIQYPPLFLLVGHTFDMVISRHRSSLDTASGFDDNYQEVSRQWINDDLTCSDHYRNNFSR